LEQVLADLMILVRLAQLVLHDQHDVVRLVLAEDVQRATTDLQFNPQGFGQPVSILRAPGREIQSLM